MITHAVLLCGGSGSRLRPLTDYQNKGMIPLDNHFIIDYPIQTLVKMGIKHVTVILGGPHFADIVSYLRDGEQFGLEIHFCYQREAAGIAHAVNLAKRYVENEDGFVVMLGDNLFSQSIVWPRPIPPFTGLACIALYKHHELNRFGVASIENGLIVRLEEKPKVIDERFDNYAITGCYVFNREFFSMFKKLKKSSRSEYEVVDIIQQYLDRGELQYTVVEGIWRDTGTFTEIDDVRELIKQGKIRIGD